MAPEIKDADLINKAKAGDKEAYAELFNRYHKIIFSYLYRYVGNRELAEDLMVETFLDVYRRLPAYREEGKFLQWLYRIATNYANKEFRRKKKIKEISLDRPIVANEDATIGDLTLDNKYRPDYEARENELSGIVQDALARLDDKYRKAILLCDLQDLSYEEAARIMKCPKGTISSLVCRARALLEQMLNKKGFSFKGGKYEK